MKHALLAVLLLCSACAAPSDQVSPSAMAPATATAGTALQADLQKIQSDIMGARKSLADFAVADFQSALADAQANGDAPAVQCYPTLIAWLAAEQAKNPAASTIGLAVAFQRTRDLNKGIKGGIDSGVQRDCAWLYEDAKSDVRAFIAKLMALFGGASVGIPVLP